MIAELSETVFSSIPGVMVRQFLFVFSDLAIEFIHQAVYRGIHVFFRGIGVDCSAAEINRGLSLM